MEVPDRKGAGYRLPTEAEWECACRAGKSTKYSIRNEPSALGESGWFGENSKGSSHPVAEKLPNDFGLYDMHGNVWEWCSDGWDADYYKRTPDDDPPGPSEAASRVFRGGGWDSEPSECRSASRYRFAPGNKSYFLGFRVARSQPGVDVEDKPRLKTDPTGARGTSAAAAKTTADQRWSTPVANTSTITSALLAAEQTAVPPLAKGSPEEQLKARSLTRSGVYFVVASEAQILEKFETVKPLIARMAQPFNTFALALRNEMLLADAEEYYNEMKASVESATATLATMTNGSRANSDEKIAYRLRWRRETDLPRNGTTRPAWSNRCGATTPGRPKGGTHKRVQREVVGISQGGRRAHALDRKGPG